MSDPPPTIKILGASASVRRVRDALRGLHGAACDVPTRLVVCDDGASDDELLSLPWPGRHVVLLLSDDEPALARRVLRLPGWSGASVLGMGTSSMSLRLRAGIAARLRVAVEHVQAWIAGSRRSPVPLWSSATAAGVPLSDWRVMGHGRLTVRDRAELLQMAIDDASDADEALLAVCGAIVGAENRVLSVASSLANVDADLDGAWLSWPTIVNDAGAETPLPMKLNDAERAALRAQAAARMG